MVERILILKKEKLSERGEQILNRIRFLCKDKKFEVIDYNRLDRPHLKEKELVVTLGGDGTFVRAANLVEDSFILGINTDYELSEGFLTSLNGKEVEKISDILEGRFEVENWQRAKVVLNGRRLKENAINEVFVGTVHQYETARYTISFRGKKEEQRSSGIIVSTGTGSSAWFKSAGGKIFSHSEKKLKFVVREPYHGQRLFIPTIFDGEIDEGEKLIIESRRRNNGVISINEAVYHFNSGDVVEVSLSETPLKVVKLKN